MNFSEYELKIAMKKYLLTLIISGFLLILPGNELAAQGMTRSTGIGTWLTFFSRLKQNWFLGVNFGALAGVHTEQSNYIVSDTETSTIIPLLLGFRKKKSRISF